MEQELKQLGALAVYLIGSRARGQERADSDIDIAVVVQDRQKADLRQILAVLTEKFPPEKLHLSLVDLAHTSPLFLYQIAKEGQLLFTSDENFPSLFAAQAMQRYFDDQYRLDIFRRQLLKRIREGRYAS